MLLFVSILIIFRHVSFITFVVLDLETKFHTNHRKKKQKIRLLIPSLPAGSSCISLHLLQKLPHQNKGPNGRHHCFPNIHCSFSHCNYPKYPMAPVKIQGATPNWPPPNWFGLQSAVCCHYSTVQPAVWGGDMFEEETILAPQRPETWREQWQSTVKNLLGKSWESLKMATKDGPRGLILLDSCMWCFPEYVHTDSYLQVI